MKKTFNSNLLLTGISSQGKRPPARNEGKFKNCASALIGARARQCVSATCPAIANMQVGNSGDWGARQHRCACGYSGTSNNQNVDNVRNACWSVPGRWIRKAFSASSTLIYRRHGKTVWVFFPYSQASAADRRLRPMTKLGKRFWMIRWWKWQ